MKIKDIIAALEHFAPLPLQEHYDNAGLQVGLTEEQASGALLCLDVTEHVIDEAVEKGCNLIIAHHPLLFKAVKCISDYDIVQRCVYKAISHRVAIYAAHTNLDNASHGVNAVIAQRIGITHTRPLIPIEGMPSAGSGLIGRIEPTNAMDCLRNIKRLFHVDCLMHNECLSRPIEKIALCGGSGAFLLQHAITQGADLFLTGEMDYHQFFGHEQRIQIATIGHYQSEQYTTDLLHDVLTKEYPHLKLIRTSINTNPIHYLY